MTQKTGIVVPTIGTRPEYLPLALKSIRAAGDAYIVLVGNQEFDATEFQKMGLIDKYLKESDPRLPAKINQGFGAMPKEVEYINWLGDDDLLEPNALALAEKILLENSRIALVYGACKYIDSTGKLLWLQKSGPWAARLLRFGPQLIPQPAALYRRKSFEAIGQLSLGYSLAFDFKLFLDLSKLGGTKYLRTPLASFRWHADSLSVKKRRTSVLEASQVRKANLPRVLRPTCEIWEFPIREATYWAGKLLSRRMKQNSQ